MWKKNTAAIINCIGASMKQDLINSIKFKLSGVMLDGSNVKSLYKTFSVTVRLFDIRFDQIITKFFNMNMFVGGNNSTANWNLIVTSIDN